MEKILIVGARQHAKILVSIIREFYKDTLTITGFIDDDSDLKGTQLLGIPILGTIDDLMALCKVNGISSVGIGISNRHMSFRRELFNRVQTAGLNLPSLIHGRAYISPFAKVGEGVVLNPGVVVNAYAIVGSNCVIYSNSTIEHETVLSDNVYIGPGVNFSSNARVGRDTFIGAGSKIIPDIIIGQNVVVGAGSVVINDIPDNVTVAGVPARFINERCKSVI